VTICRKTFLVGKVVVARNPFWLTLSFYPIRLLRSGPEKLLRCGRCLFELAE